MRFVIATAAIVALSSSAMSQQPYAGLQNRSIKTLSDQQIADLNAGRGMGLALAAELNELIADLVSKCKYSGLNSAKFCNLSQS
jgi:hypothetical protein